MITKSDTNLVPQARPAAKRDHPLGPLFYRLRPVNTRAARVWATLVAGGCLTLLATAGLLEPDPRGYGTHRALGMWPCSLPLVTGYPCPTCG
ncbi:MAG TPA: hypothetical protein VM243_03195, partial [Phycisphaerae bacterium]|nr:hypothetical protein [Phycisphaerae bacterium]